MGWEQRSGRFYFYEKRRDGRRVLSRYVGGGTLAFQVEEMMVESRQERQRQRQAQKEIRDEQNQIDRQLAEAESALVAVTHATLIAAGFHQHKGQWRKKRREK